MAAPKWTQEELNILHTYYGKHGSHVTYKALRLKGYTRSIRGICTAAQKAGIKCTNKDLVRGKNRPHRQTEEHKEKLRTTCHKIRKHFPVGTVRKTSDGVWLIKTAEPCTWLRYNRYLYEQHYGTIPEGYLVLFKDGNSDNVVIENLMLVDRARHSRIVADKNAHRAIEIRRKGMETAKANRRAALRQKYGSISMALAAGETL
jgi:hypothetical protein